MGTGEANKRKRLYMIHETLMLIATIAIFFQGFSFRRRHVPIILVSSLIILLASGLGMVLNGIGVYVNTLSNVDIYEVVVAITYVLFWWLLGYIIGGFQRVTAENVKAIKVRQE